MSHCKTPLFYAKFGLYTLRRTYTEIRDSTRFKLSLLLWNEDTNAAQWSVLEDIKIQFDGEGGLVGFVEEFFQHLALLLRDRITLGRRSSCCRISTFSALNSSA